MLLSALTTAYNSDSRVAAEVTATHLQAVEKSRRLSIDALAAAQRQIETLPLRAADTAASALSTLATSASAPGSVAPGRGGRLSLVCISAAIAANAMEIDVARLTAI